MNYMPHGHCVNYDPALLITYVTANVLIVIAYFTIPFTLLKLALKGRGRAYVDKNIELIYLVAFFGFTCALTHVSDIVNIWIPLWELDSSLRILCGIVSFFTALKLPGFIRRELKRPTNAAIKAKKEELEKLIKELNHINEI